MPYSVISSSFSKGKKISFTEQPNGGALPFLIFLLLLVPMCVLVRTVHSAGTARINCGGRAFVDDAKNVWTKDEGYNTGTTTSYPRLSLSKSVNADLYNTDRRNANPLKKLKYTLYLDNGVYKCNLHFAEMNPSYFAKSKRKFHVYINDSLRLKSFDIYQQVGKYTALIKAFDCSVTNGTLVVLLDGEVGEPKINAIEAVKVSELPPDTPGTDPGGPTPNTYRINCGGDAYKDKSGNQWLADQFYNHGTTGYLTPQRSIVGTDDSVIYMTDRKATSSDPLAYTFPKLPNGEYTVRLYFVETLNRAQGAGRRVFDILINEAVVTEDLDIYQRVGAYRALGNTYYITLTNGKGMKISFIAKEGLPKICAISITPGKGGTGEGGAHAVAGDPQTIVDSTGAGSMTVTLDGSNSYTNSPAPSEIVSYQWSWNGKVIGTTAKIQYSFPVGKNIVTLDVTDDHHKTDDATVTITVVPQLTSGLENYLYDLGTEITTMPTFADKKPVFGKIESTIDFAPTSAGFRGSKLTKNFAALMRGYIDTPSSGTYQFALESSDGSILKIDGTVVIDNSNGKFMAKATASAEMTKGYHSIEVQFFNNAGQPGLRLLWTPVNSGQEEIIPATNLFHNRKQVVTIMHQVSSNYGSTDGGNQVYVFGFGFIYDDANTKVKFGNAQATGVTVVNDNLLEFLAPAGGGTVQVAVEVPSGTSNTQPYTYITQNQPEIQWNSAQLATNILRGPTCLAFGPDRKLYIGTLSGLIYRLTLDDNMKVTETFQTNVLNGRNILGLGFNPRDTDPNNIVFYVSHNIVYHGDRNNDGKGVVSIISGAQLNQKKDIVTGLPVSERDHGVNGLIFLQDGNMLIFVGSNTNGGLPGPLTPSGLQEEKLLSATACIAYITKPNFDGHIKYSKNDSKEGTQIGGLDVEPWCFGIKNTFSGVYHSNGNIYAPDNGPSSGYGKTSESCTEEGQEAKAIDELNLLRKGHYYGHPNRARGKKDPRQCAYHSNEGSTSTADFTAGLVNLPSSMDGCIEYTANAFYGQLRTQLILSRFTGELRNVILSDDGESVRSVNELSPYGGLNVAMAWDGSLIACDFYGNLLTVITPNEPSPTHLYILSVTPVRGPLTGGNKLSIWGYNFEGAVSVQVGGKTCTDSVVSANGRRVECKVPTGSPSLLSPVTVTSDNGQSYTLPRAYKYLDV